MSLRLLLCALTLLLGARAFAQDGLTSMPQNPDGVDVYLVTVEVGEEIYTRWGHTGLRVVDKSQNMDVFYNWGMFDFNEPGFFVKYLSGIQIYFLAISEFSERIRYYRDYEQRSMWEEKLQLTHAQKVALLAALIEGGRPENRRYPYHNFYNNCSTKVRDALDLAFGGRLKAKYAASLTPRTFRWFVHDALRTEPLADLGLEVIMNDEIDDLLTPWQEMFLPRRMREELKELGAVDDAGAPRGDEKLLAPSVTVIDLPPPHDAFFSKFGLAWLLFGLPTGLALAFYGLGAKQKALRALAPRLLGVSCLTLGVWSAFAGTLMLAAWLGSGQTVLHHNANLLLFWPLDWLFVGTGFRLLFKGNKTSRAFGFGRLLIQAHAGVAVAYVVAGLTGLVHQYTGAVAANFVPMLAAFQGLLFRYAYSKTA